jgi:hypothetical protein
MEVRHSSSFSCCCPMVLSSDDRTCALRGSTRSGGLLYDVLVDSVTPRDFDDVLGDFNSVLGDFLGDFLGRAVGYNGRDKFKF